MTSPLSFLQIQSAGSTFLYVPPVVIPPKHSALYEMLSFFFLIFSFSQFLQ